MEGHGLDLLAHWISTDQERRSLDGGDRASANSSFLAQSPRMSTSFGMSSLARLSYQPSTGRRSEEVPLAYSRSLPFSRTFSLERSGSANADQVGKAQVQLEDMEAMVEGYALMSTQSTPPISVPTTKKKGTYNPPPSPVVGRSVAASMGDIETYWNSMYVE